MPTLVTARRARTVFSTPLASEPFAGLSGSPEALAFRAGTRAYAGYASGRRPYRRLPGAVTPAVDGTLALYELPGTGRGPAEIRTRSVAAASGSPETTVARHTLSGIDGLRLAGGWAAVAGERIYVPAAGGPPHPRCHELLGGLDFDGEKLTFASRTSLRVRGRWRPGRVRIEVVRVAPTPANTLPTGP